MKISWYFFNYYAKKFVLASKLQITDVFLLKCMLKNYFLIFLLCFFSCFSHAQEKQNKTYKVIIQNMKTQESCWNNDDIEGYMAFYWNSDSLKFIGKSGITYGWKTTLEHYKKSYPDKVAMGMLTFSDIKLQRIKRKLVMVTGSWKLTREKDVLQGYYTLLWKRVKYKWYIIIDHTS